MEVMPSLRLSVYDLHPPTHSPTPFVSLLASMIRYNMDQGIIPIDAHIKPHILLAVDANHVLDTKVYSLRQRVMAMVKCKGRWPAHPALGALPVRA